MKTISVIIVVLSLFLLACSAAKGPGAEIGDTVIINYEIRFANNSMYDRSIDYDTPIKFTIGKHEILPGLEKAVLGMRRGEEKKVLLSPEAAYGQPDPDKVERISLQEFAAGSRLRLGMRLPARDQTTGREVEGKIINISQSGIIVDFNNPLAGEPLWMDVTVKEVIKK